MNQEFREKVAGWDDSEYDTFCKANQTNYDQYGTPRVYLWRDGSITETVAVGPGDIRLV